METTFSFDKSQTSNNFFSTFLPCEAIVVAHLHVCSSSRLEHVRLLSEETRRSHHHCLPPSRITITGGGACVIGAFVAWCFLPCVGVTYWIYEMESMSREGDKAFEPEPPCSSPQPFVNLYRRDPLVTVVDPCCREPYVVTFHIGWRCGTCDQLL